MNIDITLDAEGEKVTCIYDNEFTVKAWLDSQGQLKFSNLNKIESDIVCSKIKSILTSLLAKDLLEDFCG